MSKPTLRTGAEADVSVFELQAGSFDFIDAFGQARIGKQRLAPVVTVRGGKEWLPEPAVSTRQA